VRRDVGRAGDRDVEREQTVSKRTICLKIAARIATETNPVTEAQLSALMTLIFAKGQK
jgi:hypothetical protein